MYQNNIRMQSYFRNKMTKQSQSFGSSVASPKLFYIQVNNRPPYNLKGSPEKSASEKYCTKNGDFYSCIRPLLQFGRCLGILPISGLWNDLGIVENLEFKWISIASITSIFMILVVFINTTFSFINLLRRFAGSGGGNATELALSAKGPLFNLTVLLIYIFFLCKTNELLKLFTTWRHVSSDLKLKRFDLKLFNHVKIFVLAIYTFAMLEAVSESLLNFPIVQRSANQSTIEIGFTPLETYYIRAYPFWKYIIPFHPVIAVFLLILTFISVQVWNYADVIIIVFSRALFFKFKVLVEETENRLVSAEDKHAFQKLKGVTWAEVRRDHLALCKLLSDFEAFLSPLIFLCYSINIFFICLQLHQGLTPAPDRTFLDTLNSTWSFFHLIFRIMAMSLTASKINEYAHQISATIQKCSSAEYCQEVERLERMLGAGPLGLSGLGCFVITRAFILVVVSVIFTMEIVLLQTSSTGTTSGPMSSGSLSGKIIGLQTP